MSPVNDYGGFSYNRRHCSIAKQDLEHCHMFKCLHCDKVNWVTNRAVRRVAGVHCNACGGPMEETIGSQRAHGTYVTGAWEGEEEITKPNKCQHCGVRFRREAALRMHINEKHPQYAEL